MKGAKAWSPAEGSGPVPQQLPPSCFWYSGDGSHDRTRGELWAPSEGPVRSDPGGPGGEPDGETVIRQLVPLAEPEGC